jgi:hypothetical protein
MGLCLKKIQCAFLVRMLTNLGHIVFIGFFTQAAQITYLIVITGNVLFGTRCAVKRGKWPLEPDILFRRKER